MKEYKHTHTHTHTHTHMHARMHAHTHTHIHTQRITKSVHTKYSPLYVLNTLEISETCKNDLK